MLLKICLNVCLYLSLCLFVCFSNVGKMINYETFLFTKIVKYTSIFCNHIFLIVTNMFGSFFGFWRLTSFIVLSLVGQFLILDALSGPSPSHKWYFWWTGRRRDQITSAYWPPAIFLPYFMTFSHVLWLGSRVK